MSVKKGCKGFLLTIRDETGAFRTWKTFQQDSFVIQEVYSLISRFILYCSLPNSESSCLELSSLFGQLEMAWLSSLKIK